MNFHKAQGLMYEGAPELWGCPRWSKEAGELVIDWYDAQGALQSVTRADDATLAWYRANSGEALTMATDLQTWLKSLTR